METRANCEVSSAVNSQGRIGLPKPESDQGLNMIRNMLTHESLSPSAGDCRNGGKMKTEDDAAVSTA